MRRTQIHAIRSLALLLPFLLAPVASALPPVNDNGGDAAVSGYDVVAYFEDGEPREGSPQWSHDWNGATWRFASEAHRAVFAADPERYAPQYGGYCAYAVAKGGTATVDPEAWSVREGKLYLNYSKRIQARWEKDVPGYVAKADANWPGVLEE
jgi:YHS domain-containing protein